MRLVSLGLSALVLLAVSACGGESEPEAPAQEAAAAPTEPQVAPDAQTTPAAETEAAQAAGAAEPTPAAPGAPSFAVIYPGGVPDGEPGDQPGGGGLMTYVTTATPDEVIAFHRARAEAEGLASVMAMNQGDARAYGAHSTQNGANLSVFATPGEDGVSVQLVWSAGG